MPGEGCLEASTAAKNRYAKALDKFNNSVRIQQKHVSRYRFMVALDTFHRNEYLNRMENDVPEDGPAERIHS